MNHKLGHVAVRVKDMDRAVAYYMSLGFNCEWESDDWRGTWILWTAGMGKRFAKIL